MSSSLLILKHFICNFISRSPKLQFVARRGAVTLQISGRTDPPQSGPKAPIQQAAIVPGSQSPALCGDSPSLNSGGHQEVDLYRLRVKNICAKDEVSVSSKKQLLRVVGNIGTAAMPLAELYLIPRQKIPVHRQTKPERAYTDRVHLAQHIGLWLCCCLCSARVREFRFGNRLGSAQDFPDRLSSFLGPNSRRGGVSNPPNARGPGFPKGAV